jgi:hypothetical protein
MQALFLTSNTVLKAISLRLPPPSALPFPPDAMDEKGMTVAKKVTAMPVEQLKSHKAQGNLIPLKTVNSTGSCCCLNPQELPRNKKALFHSHESGKPERSRNTSQHHWLPAFSKMTVSGCGPAMLVPYSRETAKNDKKILR